MSNATITAPKPSPRASTVVQSASVAAAAATGAHTVKLATGETVDIGTSPAVKSDTPTVEDLRAAVAAVDAGDVRGAAGVTLKRVVLARFTAHAARVARNVDGVRCIIAPDHKEVALRVWNDAGHGVTPANADRTPGEKSLAQYISRFSTVARDLTFGLDALGDVETAQAAYDSITDDNAAAKRDAAHAAYIAWKNTLPTAEADALSLTFDVLTSATGKQHVAAYVALITAANAD